MADYLPVYKPGQALTLKASDAVTGGQIVEVTGDGTVGPAAAASAKVIGVAGFDADTNENVTVFAGGVQGVVANGSVSAGDSIVAGVSGSAVAQSGIDPVIGIALSDASDGNLVRVKFCGLQETLSS